MRNLVRAAVMAAGWLVACGATAEPLTLTDKGYFAKPGVNVLVFSNWYDGLFSDSKISGVELIQHGQRTMTNGDVRMMPTPGQWDETGEMVERQVNPAGLIDVTLKYPAYDFTYRIHAEPVGDSVRVDVWLDKVLPDALVGKAGFNLEVLPSAYFHKSYMADGVAGAFPLYPSGPMKSLGAPKDDSARTGNTEPLPLASGSSFVLAPEDPERRVTVTAHQGTIDLYDGRNQAQNGWFVLRGLLPANHTGVVLSWTIDANAIPGWLRAPVIGHSQVGYRPEQRKVAVIELDPNDSAPATAELLKVGADGAMTPALAGDAKPWGHYLRYDYRTFDFSSVKTPGLYALRYGGRTTATFRIADDVYSKAWQPTLDVYMPIAMDHVMVNEAYRVWHGDAHRDDALQAPVNHDHIDLYAQGPTTDTKYKPFEHIPGLNVGGWLDAGDFDIRTQTNYGVVRHLVEVWEQYGLDRDDTLVDEQRRYVDLHVPDGAPDMLQQIEHGTLQLVAQFDAVGHAINGIVEPDVAEYTHLGDAVTKTDGLVYDPSLKPFEVKDGRSGTTDDRWAFTSKSSALNYGSAAALAAASRALRGHDDALADKALGIAKAVWADEHSHAPDTFQHGNTTGGPLLSEELSAAVELLATTKDPVYAKRIEALWPDVAKVFAPNARLVVQALPYMPAAFKKTVRPAVVQWQSDMDKLKTANPYGVPVTEGGWAGSGAVIATGLTAAALHRAYPDIVGSDLVYRALDYLYGTHPASDISLVSGVGSVSKEIAYGNNRADFSFIAGGVVPGILILKPDFPENKEDWPFFWGENEYVINLGPEYIDLVKAAETLKPASN